MLNSRILATAIILITSGAFAQLTREELAGRVETETRRLAAAGVEYGAGWTPPGHGAAWAMDCSNTVRWLYTNALGKSLPRTASAQYEALRAEGRLWKTRGLKGLKPGDLLFWENTYRPTRQPPITHVMIFLWRDPNGRLWMAGSQGKRGVDIYVFDPTKPMGGYHWFLWFKKKGRFVAYGRPA